MKANSQVVEQLPQVLELPLGVMFACEDAQREHTTARVTKLRANFSEAAMGLLTVNVRNAQHVAVLDGWTRHHALREELEDKGVDWKTYRVRVLAFKGLSVKEEAEKFLLLNDTVRTVAADLFRIGVTAELADPLAIAEVVGSVGLRVARYPSEGTLACVGTLFRVYRRCGPEPLRVSLRVLVTAFGNAGLDAAVIEALARIAYRWPARFDEAIATERLAHLRGGCNGVMARARKEKALRGGMMADCAAIALIGILNGRGGLRLPHWDTQDDHARAAK